MILLSIAGVAGILLIAAVSLSFISAKGQSQNLRSLYAELGMVRKWSGEATTAFYKWGWKKTSTDRVWGERIVKKAFQKAGIWLSPEDLLFFQRQCENFAAKKSVNHQTIFDFIERINARTEILSSQIGAQLHEIIKGVTAASTDAALGILYKSGIKADATQAKPKLAILQMRRTIHAAGMAILGPGSVGLPLPISNEETIHLKGFDNWEYWLDKFKSELETIINTAANQVPENIRKAIKGKVLSGLVKVYKTDHANAQAYRATIEQQIVNKDLPITMEEVERSESILYSWQFREGAKFNETDHQRFRGFMVRLDISNEFRHKIIKSLKPDISCLESLIGSLPRSIIFYGAEQKSRAFAAKLYQFHYAQLLNVFGVVAPVEQRPPAILLIPMEEIQAMRRAIQLKHQTMASLPTNLRNRKQNEDEPSDESVSLKEVINKQKKYSSFERQMDISAAEEIGWLVDLPLATSAMSPLEYREMQTGGLASYRQVNCDEIGEVDFLSNSAKAKEQRNQFFQTLMKSLVGHSMPTGSASALDSSEPPALVGSGN